MNEFQPNQILDHLFISGIFGVTQTNITNNNIHLIIDLTVDNIPPNIAGVETLRISIEDDPNVKISKYFDTCADKIHETAKNGWSTLVHCMAGVSRSATICIAYLMKYQKMNLQRAYNHLKYIRPQIRPNCGFFEQLIDYEKTLNEGKASVKMVCSASGMVPEVYKMDQDSSLGYFLPLESSKSSIPKTVDEVESIITISSNTSTKSCDSGNDADDEKSRDTLLDTTVSSSVNCILQSENSK